jgi:uncharacterized membrane protein YeiH
MDFSALQLAALAGVVAFGASGVLAVADRRLDLFGFAVVGVMTALGGGTIRSAILGVYPPWMDNWVYLTMALVGSWATVAVVKLLAVAPARLVPWVSYADAAGLGLFTVTGTAIGLDLGYRGVVAITLGVITATGGGMLRDVLVGRIPFVLNSEIYATAVVAGGTVYVVLFNLGVNEVVAGAIAGVGTFVLRMAAIHYSWSLPVFSIIERSPKQ